MSKQKQVTRALNKAQQALDRLPPQIPEYVRPALMYAMANWFAQGQLPSVMFVETGGEFPEQVMVPPDLDGVAVPEWMYRQAANRNAAAVYFAYESVEDTLTVLYQAPHVFHNLSAEVVTTGKKRDIGAWSIQTLYPEK
jgi:hypothetical protein